MWAAILTAIAKQHKNAYT